MQRRDDDELEPSNLPNEVTDDREYVDSLRASGEDPESQPILGKSLRPDERMYRPTLNIRLLKDTFEVKTTLQSQGELERLKRLVKEYFEASHFKGAEIEILANANPELLNELKQFRISYKQEHVIPFWIRLVYKGRIM